MWNNKVIILLTMDKVDVKELFVECRVDAPPAFFLLNVEFLNKKQEWSWLVLFYLGSTDSLFIEFLWGHHMDRVYDFVLASLFCD